MNVSSLKFTFISDVVRTFFKLKKKINEDVTRASSTCMCRSLSLSQLAFDHSIVNPHSLRTCVCNSKKFRPILYYTALQYPNICYEDL